MSNLTRHYHGCQITSRLSDDEGSDGYSHALTRDGVELGVYMTLGIAIAMARRINGESEPQPMEQAAPEVIPGDKADDDHHVAIEAPPKGKRAK